MNTLLAEVKEVKNLIKIIRFSQKALSNSAQTLSREISHPGRCKAGMEEKIALESSSSTLYASINVRAGSTKPVGGRNNEFKLTSVKVDEGLKEAYPRNVMATNTHLELPKGTIHRGLPNYSNKKKSNKNICFLVSFTVIGALQVFLLILGLFNFIRIHRINSPPSTEELTVGLQQIKKQMEGLKNYSSMNDDFRNTRLVGISARVEEVNTTVNLISSVVSVNRTNVTYNDCYINNYICRQANRMASISFSSCATVPYIHEDQSSYVENVYCSVSEVMQTGPIASPIASTLFTNMERNTWGCRCSVIKDPSTQLAFICTLVITICPKTTIIPLQ